MLKTRSFMCAALLVAGPVLVAGTPRDSVTAEPTREQAMSLVKEGAAYLVKHGKEAFFKQVNLANGRFHTGTQGRDPELYLFAYDGTGVCLAQGQSLALIGQNRWDAVDVVTKKKYIQEFIRTAKDNKKGGWVDYNFINPKTQKFDKKTSYLLLAEDVIIGCGIYQ